jgi:hypothetical protein
MSEKFGPDDNFGKWNRDPVITGLGAGTDNIMSFHDDDLPVLTDVIITDELGPLPNSATMRVEPSLREASPDPEEVARMASQMLAGRLSALRADIDREVAVWLTAELPGIVRSELEDLGERIVSKVRARVMADLLPELQRAVDESQPSRDAG